MKDAEEPTEAVPNWTLNDEQIGELWEEYYPRLKASIAGRVQRIRRSVASDSEIALSAFHSMIARAQNGEFPELNDEESFWKLLKTIAVRKANDLHRRLWADKRGGKLSALGQADAEAMGEGQDAGVEAVVAEPRRLVDDLEVSEMFNKLLAELPSDKHRDVILLKLQGANNEMIADALGTTTRSVQRMLKGVRGDWESGLL